ncbi:MAG: TatD family hydrolase [Rhodospirillaceae bacterium]|nr:TatD family hydrolase [Rhodospirillaceae bacterium]
MSFLVDSHCHLDFPELAAQQDAVMDRARAAGVGHFLTICTHVTRAESIRAIADKYADVSCTVGIHPHEAGKEPAVDTAKLLALAEHPKVVGFGETGLDFFYEHSPRADQDRSFRVHLAAAREARLPVVIHTRDADDETAATIAEEMGKGRFTGLIHCFSSGLQLAETALKFGLYISFSGIVTFKKADTLRDVVKAMPLDRILVETDAPYLAPVPHRGKTNEPAFVAHTAALVAELKGIGRDELAQRTTENFFRLFAKAKPAVRAAA